MAAAISAGTIQSATAIGLRRGGGGDSGGRGGDGGDGGHPGGGGAWGGNGSSCSEEEFVARR